MARWTNLATWVGPTPNKTAGGTVECRGCVVHIASGSYDGTIAWQRNPASQVSSHFIIARDGRIAQMVDTADKAWTQKAGNGHWISLEFEGRVPGDPGYVKGLESLTAVQIEAGAKLFARCHAEAGVPLQLATSPSGRGLGHHSMGAESGVDWGHSSCPGSVMKAQKPAILARALQIAGGQSAPSPDPGGLTVADINSIDTKLDQIIAATGVPGKAGVRNYVSGPILDGVSTLVAKSDTPQPVNVTTEQLTQLGDKLATVAGDRIAKVEAKIDRLLAALGSVDNPPST